MNENSELDPVEIFAGTSWEAGMLISILADNEIEAFLNDVNVGTVAPWVAEPGGAGAVKVVVAVKDYEKAARLVKNFRETLK